MNRIGAQDLARLVKSDDPSLRTELVWDMKRDDWYVTVFYRRTHYARHLHSTADWEAEKTSWNSMEVVA